MHKKTIAKQTLHLLIYRDGNSVKDLTDRYLIKDCNGVYELRKIGSDIEVYKQIIIEQEYKLIQDYFKINQIEPKLIIDCGANIGLTSLLLSNQFKNAEIFAVEPDENNFKQLLKTIHNHKNIICLENAIWSTNQTLSIDRSFGDQKDWSIRTLASQNNSNSQIQAITISDIVSTSKFNQIDFLKIDVEGAEGEIFKNLETSDFLSITNCIAIEIHDEFVNREHIYRIMKHYGFLLINSGELTIGFKK